MGIASRYNTVSNRFTAQIPDDAPYVKLEQLKDVTEVIPILTMWINTKSIYGDHPVIGTATGKVDLPQSLTDTVREMITDDEVIDAVNNGKLGFKVRTYENQKYHKTCYTIDFVDIE